MNELQYLTEVYRQHTLLSTGERSVLETRWHNLRFHDVAKQIHSYGSVGYESLVPLAYDSNHYVASQTKVYLDHWHDSRWWGVAEQPINNTDIDTILNAYTVAATETGVSNFRASADSVARVNVIGRRLLASDSGRTALRSLIDNCDLRVSFWAAVHCMSIGDMSALDKLREYSLSNTISTDIQTNANIALWLYAHDLLAFDSTPVHLIEEDTDQVCSQIGKSDLLHKYMLLLDKHGIKDVSPYIDMITETVHICHRLVDEESIPLGTSKIGGLPDLPPDICWPTWDGLPMAFIAQISLTELHDAVNNSLLPSEGMLYFFYAYGSDASGYEPVDRGCSKVLYYKSYLSELRRVPLPFGFIADAMLQPAAITFEETISFVTQDAPQYLLRQFPEEEYDRYWDVLDEMARDDVNKIGGCPDSYQTNVMMLAELVANGENTDISYTSDYVDGDAEVRKLVDAAQWRLLLQINPYSFCHFMDDTRLYFCIKERDLHELNFEKTWAVFQR